MSHTEPDWHGELLHLAGRVRLLCLDVDGVLTDGAMYYGASGEALKRFHTRDAAGLALVRQAGLEVAWLSGEDSPITAARARKLNIARVHLGCQDKLQVAGAICGELRLAWEQVAYMGDDWFDLPLLRQVGLSACPQDAHEQVRQAVRFCSRFPGGQGAVRELCDLLLEARRTS